MTISDRLGDRRSAKVAVLTDTRDGTQYNLSLVPDSSRLGEYSVRVKHPSGETESFRMFFKGGMGLEEAMLSFEEYLNTDTEGKPFEVEILPEAPPKAPSLPGTFVDEWKAELKKLKKKHYKTYPEEQFMKVLKKRISANPDKWEIGDGVGWKVMAGGRGVQINRGFTIADISPENKMALLTQVAYTGLTVSGGVDVLKDEWVPLGDLVRDRRYDRA